MNKIIKQAMRANRYYNKAINFKYLWEQVGSLVNWKFHKMLAKELDIKWYEIDEVDVLSSYNSYNASSCVTFLLHECEWEGVKFLALAFHLGGDVRGNYGDLIFINKDKEEFFEDLLDLSFEFCNYGFQWSEYAFFGEAGIINDAYSLKNSDEYNELLGGLSGYYIDEYPKGFKTAYYKTLP